MRQLRCRAQSSAVECVFQGTQHQVRAVGSGPPVNRRCTWRGCDDESRIHEAPVCVLILGAHVLNVGLQDVGLSSALWGWAQQVLHQRADGPCRIGQLEREADHLQLVGIRESERDRLVKRRRPWIDQHDAPAAVPLPVGKELVCIVLTGIVIGLARVETLPVSISVVCLPTGGRDGCRFTRSLGTARLD